MTPAEIKANLTKEQWERYDTHSQFCVRKHDCCVHHDLEALAERNQLLKKIDDYLHEINMGAGISKDIAAALKGVGE